MTRYMMIAVLILIGLCACQSSRASSAGSNAAVVTDTAGRHVIALERQIWDAERRRDRLGVDSLLAPDYVYLSAIGLRDRSKTEDLDNRFGPHVTLESYDLRSFRTVSVSPEVTALHFIADQRIRNDSVRICPRTGTSEVWVRRGGRWLLVTRTEYLIGGERPPLCADRKAGE